MHPETEPERSHSLVRILLPDRLSEALSLLEIRRLRLEPQQVRIRREHKDTLHRGLDPALVPVVTLTPPRQLPVPRHVGPDDLARNLARLAVGQVGPGHARRVRGKLAGRLDGRDAAVEVALDG